MTTTRKFDGLTIGRASTVVAALLLLLSLMWVLLFRPPVEECRRLTFQQWGDMSLATASDQARAEKLAPSAPQWLACSRLAAELSWRCRTALDSVGSELRFTAIALGACTVDGAAECSGSDAACGKQFLRLQRSLLDLEQQIVRYGRN